MGAPKFVKQEEEPHLNTEINSKPEVVESFLSAL